ncbi:MAG: ABC transporter ATP-binding protein [Acidobacteriaceae bacterium]
MAAIETFVLEKRYSVGFWRNKPKQALYPLTLTVERGEVFGFLGPNGAGKTTTLKLLMGLTFPTAGSAKILGREIDDPEMKAQIGFLPEQPYFYDHLTARELLDYYSRLSGVPAKERGKRIEAALRRVSLPDAGHTQLRKYSKGMLQRVGIAQAIIHDPAVVFLDEPMSGLDPIGRREVRDLIQGLKEEGKTIFFSTHILSDAETLCDRVGVINKGKLRGIGVLADLALEVSGKVEVVWVGSSARHDIEELGGMCHATGESFRVELPEAKLDAAIDAIRRNRAKLVSVTPVRVTLEQFFLEKLEDEDTSPIPSEEEVAK